MAIAFVQDDISVNDPTPGNVVFGSNVTAGNLIVTTAMAGSAATETPTVTDTLLNTYVERVAIDMGAHRLWLFTAENISGGANTVTWTLAGRTFDMIVAAEYSGLATSGSTDQTGSDTDTGTAATFDSGGSTTQADELVVAWLTSSASAFTAPGVGYTERQNSGFTFSHIYEDKIVAAAGVQTFDATQAGSVLWGGVGVTIKAAGSGQRFFALSRF